jgi:uncharacterized protein
MVNRTRLTSQVFCIELDMQRGYLLYAPERKTAFVANAAMVNLLYDAQSKGIDPAALSTDLNLAFLRDIGLLDENNNRGGLKPATITATAQIILSDGLNPVALFSELNRLLSHIHDRLEITYDGCGASRGDWAAAMELHTLVARACAERRKDLVGRVIMRALAHEDDLQWALQWMRSAIIRIDNDERPSTLLARLAAAAFPYDIELSVHRAAARDLSDRIYSLVAPERPSRITVNPAWAMSAGDKSPSRDAGYFVDAFRAAQQVAHDHGVELTLRGTELHRQVDFDGVVTGEYHSAGDRLLPAPSAPAHAHCRSLSCFAQPSCAGDRTNSSFVGSERCSIIRELGCDALLLAIERAEGLVWVGNVRHVDALI